MRTTSFLPWFKQAQQQANIKQHRHLVVLAGEYSWSHSLLQQVKLLCSVPCSNAQTNVVEEIFYEENNWLVYSDVPIFNANVNKQDYRHKLGSESRTVVFADSEFNIDALAALSGTLIAGGTLFIIFPENLLAIKNESGAFLQRFIRAIEQSFTLSICEQNKPLLFDNIEQIVEDNKASLHGDFPLNCASHEQLLAVQAIEKVATGHRNRPLVLTADRGRGKSCALAIACAEILKKSVLPQHILITAPHLRSLSQFFSQLKKSLPNAQHNAGHVLNDHGVIEFLPVDQIIKQPLKATLLLVDEAAGIPIYLLTRLLDKFHRIVFSSTVHGYEGAGRGFSIKFTAILNDRFKTWHQITISQPIRWQENDPVEKLIFDTCLLNAQLPIFSTDNTQQLITNEQLDCQIITSKMLLNDETLLNQLFSVLVTAHYQTKPSDLKLLLDNANIVVLGLFYQRSIVAVTLLMKEGGSTNKEVQAVKNSSKRLRNQFIPQSLLTHCGIEQAFSYHYLRIMRIAVHPQYQSLGIGSQFLTHITEYASSKSMDFLGSSFGCNQQLLNFWLKDNFQLARLGFNQDAASGEFSALILKPLNDRAENQQQIICQKFYQSFIYLLSDEYRQVDNRLIGLILAKCPHENLPLLTQVDIQSVKDFAAKERLYSSCAYSLHLWLQHQFKDVFNNDLLPVIDRLLKRIPEREVCELHQLTGKKALNQLLIQYVNNQLIASIN